MRRRLGRCAKTARGGVRVNIIDFGLSFFLQATTLAIIAIAGKICFREHPRGSRITATVGQAMLPALVEPRRSGRQAVDAVSAAREMPAENDGEHRSEWIV